MDDVGNYAVCMQDMHHIVNIFVTLPYALRYDCISALVYDDRHIKLFTVVISSMICCST